MAVARWWGHLPVRCGMTCREPNTRIKWGCDRVADPPGYDIDCWSCGARPADMSSCAVCEGSGAIVLDRCPTAILDKTSEGQDAFGMVEAYVRYKDGYLPAPGAMFDQTRCFDVALGHVHHLWAHHQRINSDKAERMRVARAQMEATKAARVEGRPAAEHELIVAEAQKR